MNDNDFIIYPNPVNSNTNITIIYPTDFTLQKIELFELSGKKIMNFQLMKQTDGIVELSLSNLNAGSYLLKILVQDKVVVKKIIIF